MANPFEILGVPPRLDLTSEDLDARYRALSREHHPDFHTGGSDTERIAILQQSAAINDAYRQLRDRWGRAEALVALADPEALAATKTLCPMFLMEAMEVREQVLEDPPDSLPTLEAKITAKIDADFAALKAHLDNGRPRQAATLLHQSNYYRKARADLRERLAPTP